LTELKQKVKNALNEGRTLILGSEVLIGFEFRSAFQTGFDKLPFVIQYTRLAGLCLMLLALALLIAPATRHRLVERGGDSQGFLAYTTRIIEIALLPFALGLGIDLYLAAQKVTGPKSALAAGIIATAFALFFWYGLEMLDRRKQGKEKTMSNQKSTPIKALSEDETTLSDKVEHVLTETRMVLPGVQALLGFQLSIILLESFDQLSSSSKYIHLVSLALIAVSIVLLMTPASYHRIVERGEDTEGFHRFASHTLLAAVAFLALGISGDFFVVVNRVTHAMLFALIASIIMLVLFYGLWFALPIYRRTTGNY